MMAPAVIRQDEGLRAKRAALLNRQAAEPFDKESEDALGKMPLPLSQELRPVLRMTPTRGGTMNPQALSPAAREIWLDALLDCCRARAGMGLKTDSIADLGTRQTISAIESRMKNGESQGGWGPARAAMLLAAVRKLMLFVHGQCDPSFGRRQREFARQPKQEKDHRVFMPEEYLAGATAIATIAEVLIEGGYCRGRTLLRDAAILGLDTNLQGRRAELWRANVGDVRHRTIIGQPALSVVLRMTKVDTHRPPTIVRDQRVVYLTKLLLEANKDAPLFRSEDGRRLSYGSIGTILARTAELVVGERGGANIMRRSHSKRADGRKKVAGPGLGQKGEKTANDHYAPNQASLGLELIQAAAARASNSAAAKKSYDT